MKAELLTNIQTHEDEEAGAPDDVQVRSRLGRGNSDLEDEDNGSRDSSYLPAEFPPRPLSNSFRLLLPVNAILIGIIPALIVSIVPVPKGFEEQGVFWKDKVVITLIAVLGLAFSALTTVVRVPAFYRVSRTRFTVVSIARTKWWYSPCYSLCAPAYNVDIQDIQSAEIRESPLLPPPLIVVPPRTTSSRQMCMIVIRRPFPQNLLGSTYQLWITPQDPRELMNVLARVLHERDTRPSPPPKKIIKTKASLPRPSPSSQPPHTSTQLIPSNSSPSSPAAAGGGGGGGGGGGELDRPSALVCDWKSIQRDVELIKYKLEGTETLEGLALKFECKVDDIKRINGMATGSLAAFSTLMLPLKPKEVPT